MKIWLVRHGESQHNVTQAMDTSIPGLGLTDRGRAQAQAWAAQQAADPVHHLAVSTMLRAQETAAELSAVTALDPVIDGRFREIEVGDLGNLPTEVGLPIYHSFLARWEQGATSARVPGGESADDVAARFGSGLAELPLIDGGTAVVVAHASAIRLWAGINLPEARPSVTGRHVDNTGRVELMRTGRNAWRFLAVHHPSEAASRT